MRWGWGDKAGPQRELAAGPGPSTAPSLPRSDPPHPAVVSRQDLQGGVPPDHQAARAGGRVRPRGVWSAPCGPGAVGSSQVLIRGEGRVLWAGPPGRGGESVRGRGAPPALSSVTLRFCRSRTVNTSKFSLIRSWAKGQNVSATPVDLCSKSAFAENHPGALWLERAKPFSSRRGAPAALLPWAGPAGAAVASLACPVSLVTGRVSSGLAWGHLPRGPRGVLGQQQANPSAQTVLQAGTPAVTAGPRAQRRGRTGRGRGRSPCWTHSPGSRWPLRRAARVPAGA